MPTCRNCDYDVHPSVGQCPHCGAPMVRPSADLEQQVRSLLDQGQKLEAVKLYKGQTGASLREAKQAVEAMQVGAVPPSEIGGDLEAELLRLLGRGDNGVLRQVLLDGRKWIRLRDGGTGASGR